MFRSVTTPEELILKCRNIAFIDLGAGEFSALYASSFALYIADMGHKVCYTECDVPERKRALLYDSIAVDSRFKRTGFIDFYEMARDDKKLYGDENTDEGVNWRIITPQDVRGNIVLTPAQMGRLIFSARGDLCIYDFGCCDMYDVFFEDMDALIFLVDPMPSRIIRASERIHEMQRLAANNRNHLWVVYNMNPGVSKRQVKSVIRDNAITWIEHLDDSLVYAAEYRGVYPWETAEIRELLTESFG